MIYSLDKINEMAEGDQDFVESVISVFLEEVPTDLEGLENALDQNDFIEAYKLAHKIKPNVDLLGMEEARKAALEIETLGKNNGDKDRIMAMFPILKNDVQQAIQELTADFDL
ncbi:Hpt domain-containing protein [Sediminicola luteus]|jgi:HPt (histidine-containing phosphotransfer) domain-containing protein|uniref:Histidine phosphotransferase n=1 Tax=Sediminicola luteus TaxID=319238 RepID=A0A2A4G3K7_9FLAO|nr:Hpt domain-containing protein [Sediminicola luteus]PCE63549.1 histidine phosphotransferase [Sediminicola luteus]